MANSNIVVLLGAGASRPVGLPLATEMVDALLTRSDILDMEYLPTFQRIVRFVLEGITKHSQINGETDVIDVERLFDAMVELSRREHFPAAPFVSWLPAVRELERTLTSDQIPGPPFDFAVREAPKAVQRIVSLSDSTDTGYLDPLFELYASQGSLTIATLNYDTSVELAAAQRHVPLTTGLERWNELGRVEYEAGAVRLLKLHGTAHLHKASFRSRTMYLPPDEKLWEDPYYMEGPPLITFGGQNKLRVDGPFLDLFHTFKEALWAADAVVIVGYSFRDAHINTMLSDAVGAKKVVALNPDTPFAPIGHDYNHLMQIQGKVETHLAEAIECAHVQVNDCLTVVGGRCWRRRGELQTFPGWCDPQQSPPSSVPPPEVYQHWYKSS